MVRIIIPLIAILAMGGSVGIVAGSVRLADEIADPPPEAILDPPKGLPATWRQADRAAWSATLEPTRDPMVTAPVDELIRSAAEHFGVPLAILKSVALEALEEDAVTQRPRMAALSPATLTEIGLSTSRQNNRVAGDLIAYLGRDLRPFDSHLSRNPGIGIALRAAHLHNRYATTARTMTENGFRPDEKALWFLAMLTHVRGEREVSACVAEAIRLGPERVGDAFAHLDPTAELLSDHAFVFRSFLRKWREDEAMERRKAFGHCAERLRAALDIPEPVFG
jgi:hypothetical protein